VVATIRGWLSLPHCGSLKPYKIGFWLWGDFDAGTAFISLLEAVARRPNCSPSQRAHRSSAGLIAYRERRPGSLGWVQWPLQEKLELFVAPAPRLDIPDQSVARAIR